MLIQHVHELAEDYDFRAMITAPTNGYWHSVESNAGRPFESGVQVENVPEVLAPGGEWYENIDLEGNSLPTFLSKHARYSVGYGYGYIATLFSKEADRGYWKWIPGEAAIVVVPGVIAPERIHIQGAVAGEFETGEPDINQRPEKTGQIMVFRRGVEGAFATVETFVAVNNQFKSEPDNVEFLDEMFEIPLDPFSTGPITASHFVQPLLLPAAALDYQLLQISSNHRYAEIIANTFLRFAKGLKDGDIAKWQELGPRMFYATTGDDADMKFVTVDSSSLTASSGLEDHIMRHIEVAGLAPMMTRMPGDEKATGQSIASARARSAAAAIAIDWESTASTALGRLVIYADGPKSESGVPMVHLKTDIGMAPENFARAEFISRLYLDPKSGMERPEFWQEINILGGDIGDPEDLARWAERANPEQARIRIDRSKLLLEAVREGLLIGDAEGREVIYMSLINSGAIVPASFEDDPEAFAKQLALIEPTKTEGGF